MIDPELEEKTSEKKDKKKKRKLKPKNRPKDYKGIDSSLIFHNTDASEKRFMGTLQDCLQDPTEAMNLEPGVNLEAGGRFISGPEFEK